MTEPVDNVEERLAKAKELVSLLESNDIVAADALMDDLTGMRESDIYQELGKITRELHEALSSFQVDDRINQLAREEVPSAAERLNYVIQVTEEAANKTMDSIEETMPVASRIETRSKELTEEWQRFKGRKMTVDEFKSLSQQIEQYLNDMTQDSVLLQTQLNDVLMAQGFQDITGQIIRNVIVLVQEVEGSMVGLIKAAGENAQVTEEPTMAEEATIINEEEDGSVPLQGPAIPGVNDSDTVADQDEVDDLLSSLGF